MSLLFTVPWQQGAVESLSKKTHPRTVLQDIHDKMLQS